jgi:hypothetical protein
MRVGATSLRKPIFRLELTRLKPPDIAKPNWKGESRKLCERQRLRTSFRQILRDGISEAGLPLHADGRLQRDRHLIKRFANHLRSFARPPAVRRPPAAAHNAHPLQNLHTNGAIGGGRGAQSRPNMLTPQKVREIAEAMHVSHPYAAFIRSGRRRPHPRHWPIIAKLVGVSPGTNCEADSRLSR